MHLDLPTPWQFSTLALRKRTASTTVGHALSPEKSLHFDFWSSCSPQHRRLQMAPRLRLQCDRSPGRRHTSPWGRPAAALWEGAAQCRAGHHVLGERFGAPSWH